jgi:hypothetical protein
VLKYHEKPWPHFTGILPEDFYNIVKDKWDTDDNKKEWNKCKNRSNIVIEDDKINTILNDISLGILSRSKDIFETVYPKLVYEKLTGICSNLFSENPPNEAYQMRKLHIDNGNKLVTGLWYFKHEDEKDDGGHLTLHNPKTKEEKIFEYGANKIVLFPNTPVSWHYITDRKESKYPRRFICMRLEARLKLHDYQTKMGKDIMTYEDVKNNYE